MKKIILCLFLGMVFGVHCADAAQIKSLPAPETTGGKPLMEALKERKSARSFDNKPIEPQVLSTLLWAAFGVNRDDGKRTAPTARNKQDIDVYVLDVNGVWRYLAKENALEQISDKDLRPLMNSQPFAANAPVTIMYVAQNDVVSGMHAGSLYQNVGLFCASAGLNNVVRRYDKDQLTQALKLSDGKEVLVTQSIGYPVK